MGAYFTKQLPTGAFSNLFNDSVHLKLFQNSKFEKGNTDVNLCIISPLEEKPEAALTPRAARAANPISLGIIDT